MKRVVDDFNLSKWLGQEEARQMLVQAGFRALLREGGQL